ncbi:MAG: formylglycine-generating enzyme family protein [Acutalibacteraceae bacterium]
MKKLYVFLAVIFAFALSLTGCNNQGGSSVNNGEYGVSYEDTQSSTEPESSSEQVLEQDNSSEEGQGASSELKTATYTVNGVDFKMILVEAGTFVMGSDNTNVAFSESPAHKVTLTQDYLMGETEVTEALWNAVMGNGGGSNTRPKTSVTWNEAHTFADRLTEIAQEQGLISDGMRFRLPTEAQWEFAAKGGNQSKGYLYAGSNDINEVAVTLENSGSSSPIDVKTKLPNELGLYDMSGNAYEWVDDYGGSYSAGDQVDPQNSTVSRQYVKRGGSNYHNFSSESYLFTTTGRYFYSSTDWTIGLRICLY